MAITMMFKMEISEDDLWNYILCLKDREEKGNNNDNMKNFLYREIPRLEKIHQKWGEFSGLENLGVEITSVEVVRGSV